MRIPIGRGTTLALACEPRVYWPVTVAAALLVGLLAYGLTTTGTDTTLDPAMAKGERVAAAGRAPLPVLGGERNRLARRLQGEGRARQRLGLVVPAVPSMSCR